MFGVMRVSDSSRTRQINKLDLSLKTFRIKTNSIHVYWQLLATALIQLYIYIDR